MNAFESLCVCPHPQPPIKLAWPYGHSRCGVAGHAYFIAVCLKFFKVDGSKKVGEVFLLDSLGGIVEQHILVDQEDWELFQFNFINCLIKNDFGIIVVTEEIGWGIVPATAIGHLFRERLSTLSSLLSQNSKQKWLAVNGTAIDLDKIGHLIP